jgi:hypothetical protein
MEELLERKRKLPVEGGSTMGAPVPILSTIPNYFTISFYYPTDFYQLFF